MTAPALAPSPEARAAVDEMRRADIVDLLDLVTSYSIGGREAAWRGDMLELGVHIRQLRDCIKLAITTFNEMEGG